MLEYISRCHLPRNRSTKDKLHTYFVLISESRPPPPGGNFKDCQENLMMFKWVLIFVIVVWLIFSFPKKNLIFRNSTLVWDLP